MTEAATAIALIVAAMFTPIASDDVRLMARAIGWETLGASGDRPYVAAVIRYRML
jgi:hypothetical protein